MNETKRKRYLRASHLQPPDMQRKKEKTVEVRSRGNAGSMNGKVGTAQHRTQNKELSGCLYFKSSLVQ